jgi:hypothetical protein
MMLTKVVRIRLGEPNRNRTAEPQRQIACTVPHPYWHSEVHSPLFFRMGAWIAVLLAGVVGVGWVIKRRSMSWSIDAGGVSESWLREQRAEKQPDRHL